MSVLASLTKNWVIDIQFELGGGLKFHFEKIRDLGWNKGFIVGELLGCCSCGIIAKGNIKDLLGFFGGC